MNETFNTIKDAVELALHSLNTDEEYKINGASPKEVNYYLEDVLGFELSDSDYDTPDDSVFYRYENYEKGLVIILESNGWTHYVGVSGYTLDFLSDN